MQLQPKHCDGEFMPVAPAARQTQSSEPATVAAIAGATASPIGSPALALQQQLVDRMADLLNGSDLSAASELRKWPMLGRLAIIVGGSALLWLATGSLLIAII